MKVSITGNAVVMNSSVRFDELEMVAKYRPEELTLRGGEDGKEPIFTIFVRPGKAGSINKNGAVFGGATRDENKLASITFLYTGAEDTDIKEYIVNEYGDAISRVCKIEEKLPAVVEEIKGERAAVLAKINVVQ